MAGSSTTVSTATTERERAIEQALGQIERRFGKGAIMKLGDRKSVVEGKSLYIGGWRMI